MPLIPRAARRSAAGITRSSAIASRVEHDTPRLRRFLTCPSSVPQDVAERDQPGSSSVEAPNRSAVTPRPSQPKPASDTDVDSDDDTGTAVGVVAREWLHSWQPANISGNRQYTKSPRLKKRPKNANLPAVPRQVPKPAKKSVRVKGKGVLQHLKTKVALRFVDKDGRSLFIRKANSKGHRGLWQLPNVHIHTTDCVHLQGIIIARGFMKRVPAQFPLEAHAFMSSRRLGQPMLVMILEARVDCADVQPARCGFKETDFKWVSTSEYEAQCGEMSEILYMRSAWHVRGRNVATFSFHSKPEFEDRQRAILPIQGTFDFENQPYPTQRYLMLFVAAVCVYDKQAGKVLIAKRTKGNPPGQRGKWEWPGGKVDPGETTNETAVREIKEELNLRLDINALKPATFIEKKYFKRNLVIVFYICSKFTGRAKGMERQPVRWVNREELLQCRDDFLDGDDPFTDIVLKVMEKANKCDKSK